MTLGFRNRRIRTKWKMKVAPNKTVYHVVITSCWSISGTVMGQRTAMTQDVIKDSRGRCGSPVFMSLVIDTARGAHNTVALCGSPSTPPTKHWSSDRPICLYSQAARLGSPRSSTAAACLLCTVRYPVRVSNWKLSWPRLFLRYPSINTYSDLADIKTESSPTVIQG
jgi:hypothetical protein